MDFGDVIKAMKEDNTKKFARKGWNGKGIYIQLQVPDKGSKMTLPYIYMVTSKLVSDNPDAPKGYVPWLASQTDMLCDDWIEVASTPFGLINRVESCVCSITAGEYIERSGLDRQTDPKEGGCLCAHVMKELQDYKFDNQPNPDKNYVPVKKRSKEEAEQRREFVYDIMTGNRIHNPAHYCKGRKYQPWDVIIDWDLDFLLGNAVKYIARAGRKQQAGMTVKQSEEQDILKAIEYLQKKLEIVRGEVPDDE